MISHSPRDPRWMGRPSEYQMAAARVYTFEVGRSLKQWSWITTACDLEMCLSPGCMIVHSPRVIKYDAGVCIYCGFPSGTVDHLLPEPMTGRAMRALVAVVPACADCNSRINDFPCASVTERRAKAHASILKKHGALLRIPDKTPAELRELGPTLRSVALKNNELRRRVRLRLSWPDDPLYDIKAFQRSGIDDPGALGLVGSIGQGGRSVA